MRSKISLKFILRTTSVALFIVGVIWILVDPSFDALAAFLSAILTLLGSFLVDNEDGVKSLDRRSRQILLNLVESFWIKGVLEKSLQGVALLELGVEEVPKAIKYPWSIKKEATSELLPERVSMFNIFAQIDMGHSVLILGAPGSGKTTVLLELARHLIARARSDEMEPIPIVLNLASWTEKHPLTDWLAQNLHMIYKAPKNHAKSWIRDNKLLFLLDGLDEVQQNRRSKCVDAINQFRMEHGLTSIAVCSRSQDYEDLNAKLYLDSAIEVQPLTQHQILKYLNIFGNALVGIRERIKKDDVLRELAATPLFLSIMAMTYHGKQNADINVLNVEAAQRSHLFDAYVERMFEHPSRAQKQLFRKERVLHWISWLAHKMVKKNLANFLPSNLSPNWLNQKTEVSKYRLLAGAVMGLSIGLTLQFVIRSSFGLIFGLILWLFFLMLDDSETKPLIFTGLTVGFVVWWITRSFMDWESSLKLAGILGAFAGFLGIAGGVAAVEIGNELKFRSYVNFLYSGLTVLVMSLCCGALIGLKSNVIFGLALGLVLGLSGVVLTVWISAIQVYTLRIVFSASNFLPFRIIRFLDHCVDLVFLRRVGNAYIFIHPLLMEYFAAMYSEDHKSS